MYAGVIYTNNAACLLIVKKLTIKGRHLVGNYFAWVNINLSSDLKKTVEQKTLAEYMGVNNILVK